MDFHFSEDHSASETISGRDKSLAIVPHFSSALSILGSAWIIIDIVRDHNKKLGTVYHRLLLGMSSVDLLSSCFYFLSTWPIPEGTPNVYAASGNTATCTMQGFFVQLGIATPLYNGFLSIYYLLVLRYGWKEHDFRRVERCMHAFSLIFALGTAFASLAMKLYNSANLWCWIAPLPLDCASSMKNNGESTCIRGDNAWFYRLVFYYVWLWISVIAVSASMFLVFWTVFQTSKTMKKWSKGGKLNSRNHVKEVAIQSTLYVGAFYLTAIFPSLTRFFQAKWNCTTTFYPLVLLMAIFHPMQGFWNFFIYMRPRYLRYRKKHKDWSLSQVVWQSLRRTVCCSLDMNEFDDDDDDNSVTTTQPRTVSTEQSIAMVEASSGPVSKISAEEPIAKSLSSKFCDGVGSKDDKCKLGSPLEKYDRDAIRQSRHISTNGVSSRSIGGISDSGGEVSSEEDTAGSLPSMVCERNGCHDENLKVDNS